MCYATYVRASHSSSCWNSRTSQNSPNKRNIKLDNRCDVVCKHLKVSQHAWHLAISDIRAERSHRVNPLTCRTITSSQKQQQNGAQTRKLRNGAARSPQFSKRTSPTTHEISVATTELSFNKLNNHFKRNTGEICNGKIRQRRYLIMKW